MASSDRIINKNAKIARQDASEKAVKRGQRKISWAEVARRMTRQLCPKLDPQKSPAAFEKKTDSIYRTLTALRSGAQLWRTDYIDAFCASVGILPEQLMADEYDSTRVTEASRAGYLSLALGRRLSDGEVNKIVTNLNQELDRPGMFNLVTRIADALLEAPTRAVALEDVTAIILKSPVFEAKPARKKAKSKRRRTPN